VRRTSSKSCPNVFPGQDRRFSHPGKSGQARLFAEAAVPHPKTRIYAGSNDLDGERPPGPFPFVLKLDWGGEGRNVFLIDSPAAWTSALARLRAYEATGQGGFLVQELIPAAGRALRVAVIGTRAVAYWRVRPDGGFAANLAHGATLDHHSDPQLIKAGVEAALQFCRHQHIDLAGLDLLFDARKAAAEPLFLEINWVFGRRGLGGSEGFYRLLIPEIHRWLARRHLAVRHAG